MGANTCLSNIGIRLLSIMLSYRSSSPLISIIPFFPDLSTAAFMSPRSCGGLAHCRIQCGALLWWQVLLPCLIIQITVDKLAFPVQRITCAAAQIRLIYRRGTPTARMHCRVIHALATSSCASRENRSVLPQMRCKNRFPLHFALTAQSRLSEIARTSIVFAPTEPTCNRHGIRR